MNTSVRFGGIYLLCVQMNRSETSVRFGGIYLFMCSDRDVFVCSWRSEHKCEVWRDLPVYVFR